MFWPKKQEVHSWREKTVSSVSEKELISLSSVVDIHAHTHTHTVPSDHVKSNLLINHSKQSEHTEVIGQGEEKIQRETLKNHNCHH